ncbi:CDC5 cell division cycle 5-like protein [Chytridiales sp. JEL 0842]|nr:CDC5 cell division cycle 5-like protein [Chytridiales sp. JEL 0842]
MYTSIALFGLTLAGLANAQTNKSGQPGPMNYDVAAGSLVTASSTYTTGSCAYNNCGGFQVVNNSPLGNDIEIGQWVSAPGSCEKRRNESLTLDWSGKYGTQLLSEVRLRYGELEADDVSLVLYSEVPMNIPNPTATTFEDESNWQVFLFTEPVTASGMRLTFTGLKSKDDVRCFATVQEVQAWTGVPPSQIDKNPPASSSSSSLPPGAIAALILLPLLFFSSLGAFFFFRTQKAQELKSKLAVEIELKRQQISRTFRGGNDLSRSDSTLASPTPGGIAATLPGRHQRLDDEGVDEEDMRGLAANAQAVGVRGVSMDVEQRQGGQGRFVNPFDVAAESAAVMKYGKNQWARISSLLTRKTPKQCKARWFEWLDPSIKKTEWSREEDEKLLHLAKLMPTQWRTIAPIVGRTPSQCLERYQRLLDEAESKDDEGDAGPSADDVRKLRPGEIDPEPESKPARPDPVDMDEDEKEMLSEARARLANTEGKKAKRKAREKQMEEARRLTALQKRRELKAAGIDTKLKVKRKGMDYNADIPFHKRAPAGFYDVADERDRENNEKKGLTNVLLSKLDGKRRSEIEEEERRKDAKRQKLNKEKGDYVPPQALKEAQDAEYARSERRKLNLPAPQVGDAEIEELIKIGSAADAAKSVVDTDDSSASKALLSDYSALPLPTSTPLRTPRTPSVAVDNLKQQARNLRAMEQMQTPLLGEHVHLDSDAYTYESGTVPKSTMAATPNPLAAQLTPRVGGGPTGMTPRASVPGTPRSALFGGRTPVRDQIGINTPRTTDGFDETPRAERERQSAVRNQLSSLFQSLPKPKNDFEIVLPDTTPVADDDNENNDGVYAAPKGGVVEDMEDVYAREKAKQMKAEEERLAMRSTSVKRDLPRPLAVFPGAFAVEEEEGLSTSEKLIREEMKNMVLNDLQKHPQPRQPAGARMVPPNPEWRQTSLTTEDIRGAEELVASELEKMLGGSAGDARPNEEEFANLHETVIAKYLFILPTTSSTNGTVAATGAASLVPGRFETVNTATTEDKILASQKELEQARERMKRDHARIQKMEKKLSVTLGGYLSRSTKLKRDLAEAFKELEDAEIQLRSFEKLKVVEDVVVGERVESLRAEVKKLEEREKFGQEKYQRLMSAREMHILVPARMEEGTEFRSEAEKKVSEDDKEQYVAELKVLASDLSFEPVIHLITVKNYKDDIATIPFTDLIFNLCDGCDVDGMPGPSIALLLEAKKFPNVVGCDSVFINNTLTKNGMKKIFRENMVSTPPGFGVTKDTDLEKEVADWGMTYPLFVKISDSYGSVGIDDSSVCFTPEDLRQKVNSLLETFQNLTVEEFIEGPEFSVLVSGNCRDETQTVIVYPPAERRFPKEVPPHQRFITFKSNWNTELQLHEYAKVEDDNDSIALQDLARRGYIACSGNCFGRVDIRKRDVSGKFYVLEVNASCGVGAGSSSDFILNLAGQTTGDFFKILLGNFLIPQPMGGAITDEPDEFEDDEVGPLNVLPITVGEKISELLRNPSLALLPNPVVHVIVAAVITDEEAGTVDPEGKLAYTFGKDIEYQSELESIFRALGYDPILHIFNYDDVESALGTLSKDTDLVFNACMGSEGLDVANLLKKLDFRRVVGLNGAFYEESRNRETMFTLLEKSRLSCPVQVTCTKKSDIEASMAEAQIKFPVYVKPALSMSHSEGFNTGRRVDNQGLLMEMIEEFPDETSFLIQEFVFGSEYRVLVAGDARDSNADVIVFPPALFVPNNEKTRAPQKHNLFRRKLTRVSTLLSLSAESEEPKRPINPFMHSYRPLRYDEVFLDMDLRDLARRAYTAVHGSCYGLVTIIDRFDGASSGLGGMGEQRGGLVIIGVSGDVRFGEKSKCGILLKMANQSMESLFAWLLRHA